MLKGAYGLNGKFDRTRSPGSPGSPVYRYPIWSTMCTSLYIMLSHYKQTYPIILSKNNKIHNIIFTIGNSCPFKSYLSIIIVLIPIWVYHLGPQHTFRIEKYGQASSLQWYLSEYDCKYYEHLWWQTRSSLKINSPREMQEACVLCRDASGFSWQWYQDGCMVALCLPVWPSSCRQLFLCMLLPGEYQEYYTLPLRMPKINCLVPYPQHLLCEMTSGWRCLYFSSSY